MTNPRPWNRPMRLKKRGEKVAVSRFSFAQLPVTIVGIETSHPNLGYQYRVGRRYRFYQTETRNNLGRTYSQILIGRNPDATTI